MTEPTTPADKSAPDNGDLHADRDEYQLSELHRDQLTDNPLDMFEQWLQLARKKQLKDATAMTLATATRGGIPSARTVLLKQYGTDGFCWYTCYDSRKGEELAENPNAALLFYWRELERQIRIEGHVEKLTAEQSDNYFHSRPDGSKYSAIASPQSRVIPNQAWLHAEKKKLMDTIAPDKLQRPASWGGYRLIPTTIEFWQGRPDRSHDRFLYTDSAESGWQIDRLAP